jgi:hypothetical protein
VKNPVLVSALTVIAGLLGACLPSPVADCPACRADWKIDPGATSCGGCRPPEGVTADDPVPANELLPACLAAEKAGPSQPGRVASMVRQALQDQAALLKARRAELRRWDRTGRARFALWFGTTDEAARARIDERIGVLLQLNEEYSVRNFRRAVPSRPGVFAFVFASDPSHVFLDRAFVSAPAVGTNSRAGTVTHEMSHFTIAGGTRDHAYGTTKCRALARSSPALALGNADSFEFYVEGAN